MTISNKPNGGSAFLRLIDSFLRIGTHHVNDNFPFAIQFLPDPNITTVLQCDAGGFGLEALRAIAALAAEEGASLTPHSCNSVNGLVVACHLQRAIPNGEVQEFETFDSPFIHSIFNEPFTLRDGYLVLPDGTGLGFTLNEETVKRYRVA